MQKWAIVPYMTTKCIKGTSSMKIYRKLGIRQATAWFLMQRIREGFESDKGLLFLGPVEVDETHVAGRKRTSTARRNC